MASLVVIANRIKVTVHGAVTFLFMVKINEWLEPLLTAHLSVCRDEAWRDARARVWWGGLGWQGLVWRRGGVDSTPPHCGGCLQPPLCVCLAIKLDGGCVSAARFQTVVTVTGICSHH